MNPEDKIWTEKYRPKSIEDYVFPSADVRAIIDNWDRNGIFSNLVLSGVQGTGKSSFGYVVLNRYNIDPDETLRINGSTQNKLDVVRDVIVPFCKMNPIYGDYKAVVIEEAHRFTKDAQQAMFDVMEKYLKVRFIFTTNYIKKIEAPIISRCPGRFDFNEHTKEDVMDRLCFIIENEVEEGNLNESAMLDKDIMEKIEAHYDLHEPDIRSAISSLQSSVMNDGKQIGWPGKGTTKTESFEAWVECWTPENFDFDLALTLTDGIDNNNYNEYYSVIYNNVPMILNESGLQELTGDVIIDLSEYLFKAMNNLSESAIQRIHLEAFIYRFRALVSSDGE